jgi:hypothetical protein
MMFETKPMPKPRPKQTLLVEDCSLAGGERESTSSLIASSTDRTFDTSHRSHGESTQAASERSIDESQSIPVMATRSAKSSFGYKRSNLFVERRNFVKQLAPLTLVPGTHGSHLAPLPLANDVRVNEPSRRLGAGLVDDVECVSKCPVEV